MTEITLSGGQFFSLLGAIFTLAIFLYTIRLQIKSSHMHLEKLMNECLPQITADQKEYMRKTDRVIEEMNTITRAVIAIEVNTRK